MKKLLIAACTAAVVSGTAIAGPVPERQAHSKHNQHEAGEFGKGLLGAALFIGAAIAINEALDNDHSHHHADRPQRPHRPGHKPNHNHNHAHNKPHKPHKPHKPQRPQHNPSHDYGHNYGHNHAYNRPHKPNHRPHKPSYFEPNRPYAGNSINQRQQRQKARIQAGIRNGDLTHREAKQLRQQQRQLARLEAHFRADGHFSKKERKIMQRKLDQASQHIRQLRNNHRYS